MITGTICFHYVVHVYNQPFEVDMKTQTDRIRESENVVSPVRGGEDNMNFDQFSISVYA